MHGKNRKVRRREPLRYNINMATRKKALSFQKRVEELREGYKALHKKYSIDATLTVMFPQKKIPRLARLALKIVGRYGGKLEIQLFDSKEKK